MSRNDVKSPCGHGNARSATRKSALILAGAAGKGPFAAGALTAIAGHPEFEVTCVVGTSSGALNAAVYAAGLRVGEPARAAQLLWDLWKDEASWWHILTKTQRLKIVRDALAEFQRKPPSPHRIQLRMVATSLRGEETPDQKYPSPHYTTFEKTSVFYSEDLGNEARLAEIAEAAVASAALPGFFGPVWIGREPFADGGIVDNAPIGPALDFDKEIDCILVVTPDPRIAETRRRIGHFNIRTIVDVVLRERLTRDLMTARSFNDQLRKLRSIVDLGAVRDKLDWRILDFVEIRPDAPTPGNPISGFVFKKQRTENLDAGSRAATTALDDFSSRASVPAPAPRPTAEVAPRAEPPGASRPMPAPAPPQSLHLRKSSELLVIAPIKPGLVPVPVAISYTTRLGTLLETLFMLRNAAVEQGGSQLVGPLERVTTLKCIQWAIIDEGTRLLLAVTFDGPWESYIRGIVDDAGPFLDLIFGHCVGYEGHASDDGYDAFASWVRARQVQCQFFHSAFPDLTSDDVRYLQQVQKLRDNPSAGAASTPGPVLENEAVRTVFIRPPVQTTDPDQVKNNLKPFQLALNAFYTLSETFPDGPSRDKQFIERVAILQLDLLIAKPPRSLPAISQATWAWYDTLRKSLPEASKPECVDLEREEHEIQGNILTGYQQMVRGRVVFLEFVSAAAGAEFLRAFKVTTEAESTTANGATKTPSTAQNIALTYAGLKTLGLDPAVLGLFPEEFQEGMDARSPMLGDVGPAHPSNWVLPIALGSGGTQRVALSNVDAIVVFQETDKDDGWVERQVEQLQSPEGPVKVLAVQPLHRWNRNEHQTTDFKEPFGFADGLSQPIPLAQGFVDGKDPMRDRVALGEILLGYKNQKGELQTYPAETSAIFKNGSFLAIRKFRQKVKAFDKYFADIAAEVTPKYPGLAPADSPHSVLEELKAKALGRYPDGTPLADLGPSSPYNDFDFSNDPNGEKCPLSAHIRRANPRRTDIVVPRIMRRGFAFDENEADKTPLPPLATKSASNGGARPHELELDEPEKGLVFMAYCASLAQQYEVVQKWVNGANSTGTLGAQVDPLLSVPTIDAETFAFPYAAAADGSTAAGVVRVKLPNAPLVTVDWGLYLFAPSKVGLQEIASRAGAATPRAAAKPAASSGCPFASASKAPAASTPGEPSMVDVGNAIIAELDAMTGPEALEAWRAAIEDVQAPAKLAAANALWAAVRALPGFKDTPYGLLVGREKDVWDVLARAPSYSVSEYGNRMRSSFGLLYLGQDPGLDYWNASKIPNTFIGDIGRGDAYAKGKAVGAGVLEQAVDMGDGTLAMDLQLFVDAVLARLVTLLFGFPADQPVPVDDYWWIGNYIFGPQPDAALQERAMSRGKAIHEAGLAYVRDVCALHTAGNLSAALGETLIGKLVTTNYGTQDEIARAWIGAINGFLAPTSRAARSVLDQWIESAELWRVQQEFDSRKAPPLLSETDTDGYLPRAVIKALMRGPVPPLLHRTLVGQEPFELGAADGTAQSIRIPAGKRIVLGLASAAQGRIEGCPDAAVGRTDPSLLFGGDYAKKREGIGPVHACSGKELALGVIMGMAAALMERRDIRRTARLMVTFDKP